MKYLIYRLRNAVTRGSKKARRRRFEGAPDQLFLTRLLTNYNRTHWFVRKGFGMVCSQTFAHDQFIYNSIFQMTEFNNIISKILFN